MQKIKLLLLGVLMVAAGYVSAEPQLQDDVLLLDGDLTVTRDDLDRYLRMMLPESEKRAVLASEDRMMAMIQNIYIIRVLSQKAEQLGAEVDKEQMDWELNFERNRRLVQAAQEGAIARAQEKFDWDGLAKETYLAEKDKFKTEEMVDASHVLISTEQRSDEEALALAKSLREKLLKGEGFDVIARSHSDDKGSATRAGNLGRFDRKKMVKPFADAAFALSKVGQLSEPVKTQFGYHIIKLNEKFPAKTKSFDAVKQEIINSLKARSAGQIRDQLVTDTRSNPDVKVNREALAKIRSENDLGLDKARTSEPTEN